MAAALGTAALVNVAQFPAIERQVGDWYEAVNVKPGHDLLTLAENHFGSTQGRYVVYLQLREIAPNMIVEVPAELGMPVEHFLGLGAASAVEEVDATDPIDAIVAERLTSSVVATGEDRHAGAYSIAVPATGPVERVVVVDGPDRTWLVEVGLLAAAREATS